MPVKNTRILVIPDIHAPYHHRDTLKFLKAVKEKIEPTRVIQLGDELDMHAASFHTSDPDLLGAGQELKAGVNFLKELKRLFPVMDILESNHGSMAQRKAKVSGLSKLLIKSPNEAYGIDSNWKWYYDLTLKLPSGRKCYFHHGLSKSAQAASRSRGMCIVQGHHHSQMGIQYTTTPEGIYWGLAAGCLIDDNSLAFAYNKTTTERPSLGCAAIIDSTPIIIPMMTSGKQRKWTGKLPRF